MKQPLPKPPVCNSVGRGVPRIAALGGGTGLPIVLGGLKDTLFPPEWRRVPIRGRDRLTAIVTVADDGGSSGRLREAYRILAPGDIRNCLVALSGSDGPLTDLFQFRFDGQHDVGGHSLGNLILAALAQVESDFARAVERAAELLSARGRVFPATIDDTQLVADLADGSRVKGETRIAASRAPIARLHLEPREVAAVPQACDALRNADLVVLGPGSLYTSLLPTLLVPGIVEAIRHSSAHVVLVMNLMTQPGETDGYSGTDHVRALRLHAPELPLHDVLVNTTVVESSRVHSYAAGGASRVLTDAEEVAAFGCRVVERDVLAEGPKVRHDPLKLATALLELAAPGESGADDTALTDLTA